ncbi:AfsR/SARP family transcriptional regulator [Thermogemmatispora carboxidivorans]|uniref:AfsR/SARP family transcriptional regulator n=1 Tax=Thermogemmatispora carboxidivorans TaxID=1382306 RepID=UPI00069B23A9|nr:BTAD domain-containing putative transcriptional regulator [Thermogemmatispora carboxidivorans]
MMAGDAWDVAASPLFRVWLCGPLVIERRHGTGYQVLPATIWGGSGYPRRLLKGLLCSPGRQARREVLLDRLWPEVEPEQAASYLNLAATRLRKVLEPGGGLPSLLESQPDGQGYRLPGQEQLWVDAEAALWLLQQAERQPQLPETLIPLLEEAVGYWQRGPFLEGEEGNWVWAKRAIHERAVYRAKLWLAALYEQQGLLSAAEQLLTGVLEEDPTDEDVLGLLLRLLGRQGMRHRARRLYEQFQQTLLQEEGRQPGIRVQHVLKQVLDEGSSLSLCAFFAPADSHEVSSKTKRIMSQQSGEDHCSTMNALRRHLLETSWKAIESWSISSLVGPFKGDNSLDPLIPLLLKSTPADQTMLQYWEGRVEHLWCHRHGGILSASDLLRPACRDARLLTAMLGASLLPPERQRVCRLLSQTLQLLGEIWLDLGRYAQGRATHYVALTAAEEGNDPLLIAICWGRISLASLYLEAYHEACSAIEYARALAKRLSSPSLQGWLAAIAAEIHAHYGQVHECLQALEEARACEGPEGDPREAYLVHFDKALCAGYQGACFRVLAQPPHQAGHQVLSQAQAALQGALQSLDPAFLQRKPTFLTDLAIVTLPLDLEEACLLAKEAALLAEHFRLRKVLQRLSALRQPLLALLPHSTVKDLLALLAWVEAEELSSGERSSSAPNYHSP